MRLAIPNGGLFIEIRQGSMKILQGQESLDLPIERQSNGRLTAACREKIAATLSSNWLTRFTQKDRNVGSGVSLPMNRAPCP